MSENGHLRYDPATGHLLYAASGHLVGGDCFAGDCPPSVVVTVSGVTHTLNECCSGDPNSAMGLSAPDVNGAYTLPFDEFNDSGTYTHWCQWKQIYAETTTARQWPAGNTTCAGDQGFIEHENLIVTARLTYRVQSPFVYTFYVRLITEGAPVAVQFFYGSDVNVPGDGKCESIEVSSAYEDFGDCETWGTMVFSHGGTASVEQNC